MSSSSSSSPREREPKRIRLATQNVELMSPEELLDNWQSQLKYVEFLENKCKIRDQEIEEKISAKDAEIAAVTNQIDEIEKSEEEKGKGVNGKEEDGSIIYISRSALCDAASNLLMQRLRNEMLDKRYRCEQHEAELKCWQFISHNEVSTCDKMMAARCQQLINENHKLGTQLSNTRLSHLQKETSLTKHYQQEISTHLKESCSLTECLESEMMTLQGSMMALYSSVKSQLPKKQQQQQQEEEEEHKLIETLFHSSTTTRNQQQQQQQYPLGADMNEQIHKPVTCSPTSGQVNCNGDTYTTAAAADDSN